MEKNTNEIDKSFRGEFAPHIVKKFYSQIKRKGYVVFAPNKENNTLFLRKFHKKYNNLNSMNEIKTNEHSEMNSGRRYLPQINKKIN